MDEQIERQIRERLAQLDRQRAELIVKVEALAFREALDGMGDYWQALRQWEKVDAERQVLQWVLALE